MAKNYVTVLALDNKILLVPTKVINNHLGWFKYFGNAWHCNTLAVNILALDSDIEEL